MARYTALERLEGKKLPPVPVMEEIHPTSAAGARRVFAVTPKNVEALRATHRKRALQRLSTGLEADPVAPPLTPSPPRLALLVLLAIAFADPEWRDQHMLGDLQEEFSSACARDSGPSHARWWYRRQALGLTLHRLAARLPGRSRMPQRFPEPAPDRAGMLSLLWYDLRQAWRSVRQHPALSAPIELVLAVALAANATIFALADAMVLHSNSGIPEWRGPS